MQKQKWIEHLLCARYYLGSDKVKELETIN